MRARTTLLKILLGAAMLSTSVVSAFEPLPARWIQSGSRSQDYVMETDRSVTHGGKASGTLRSQVPKPNGFGTLMQLAQVGDYRGKRVRLSGYVKTEQVQGWAGLWLRIDGENPADPGKFYSLGFDNMQERAIKGTTDWKRHEIVLDVPESSLAIAFGILLVGRGQAWVDDLKLESVGKDVPLTGSMKPMSGGGDLPIAAFKQRVESYHKQPANLDFEE